MPNSPDTLREKLYDEYEDSLFRLVMHDAAEKEGSLLLQENESLKNDPELIPSEEAAEKFEKLVKARLKKNRSASRRHIWYKAVNRVAIAVLALTITFSVAMMSVNAFRVRVLNLLINIEEKYTSFQLEDDGNSDRGNLTINWTDEYMPGYIPEGYEISNVTNTESIKSITYINSEDGAILYNEFSSGTNVAVDSENASRIETIEINGNTGTLIVKAPMASVIWEMDGKLFLIQGNIGADEAVRIAESVKLSD